jgi:outer membrane protein TolC
MNPVSSALLALLCAAPLGAAEGPAAIGLAEVLKEAPGAPEALAAREQSRRQEAVASAHWRAAFLPKLAAGAEWQHTDRDLELELFPIGQLDLGQSLWIGGLVAQQPILDVEAMVYGTRAQSKGAEAAALAAEEAGKEAQNKALGYYLQALELRAQRKALEEYAQNLAARHNEIQRLYELGGVGESELLKVKLGVDDAHAGARELKEKERLLGGLLAQSLGQEGILSPVELPEDLPSADLPAAAPEARADLKALELQAEAADAAAAGAESGFLPKVNASLSYLRADQELLNQQDWVAVGATATWTLFDGAVRQAKEKAAEHEAAALREKRRSAVLGLRAQSDDARAMLALKREEYGERLRAVAEAQRAADLEFERLRQGKVTVNNLVDAEDVLKDRKEKAALSRVQWWEQWFQGQMASGSALSLP